MSQQPDKSASLAHGAPLSSDSWSDFVTRLRHDCVGEGVHDHYTADAIFKVEARVIIYGIDRAYTDKQAVICDYSTWFSPLEYWEDLDDEQQSRLNQVVQQSHECDFLELDERDQWDLLDEIDDHSVVGWDEKWEHVNSHFTKDAAEAFIERKRHDYRKGIRVYVDAQTHCWEYNTIKEAILQGRIGLTDELQRAKEERDTLLEELVIILGSLKEICHLRQIPRPESSICRAESAIFKAKGGAA
jgi:hypothetical protein